jgi:hypothetical protein
VTNTDHVMATRHYGGRRLCKHHGDRLPPYLRKPQRVKKRKARMTDTETLRLLRQVEVVGRANQMSRVERERYLRRNRWRRSHGNVWEDKDGRRFSFGAAVRELDVSSPRCHPCQCERSFS